MKKLILAIFIFTGYPLLSQQINELKVVNHKYFAGLPSASGVEIYKNKIYLVADDLPWLIKLNQKWKVVKKYPVSGITQTTNGRTPKKIKADFESMAMIKQHNKTFMLILSSGSKKAKRDTAFLFSMKKKRVIAKRNLRPWFENIKKEAGINTDDEINIEGVAVSSDKIYVLHRGNVSGNFVAVTLLNKFLDYLNGKTEIIPKVTVFKFNLPAKKGVKAGFSGVCSLPNNKGLLVTASLEATEDVLNDGTVLGSYLGYIPFEGIEEGTITLTPITDARGKMLPKKQEGVVIIPANKKGYYRTLTVCDNDDGSSDIFELQFIIK